MWGGKVYFNSLCSSSRGLAVLVKDNTPITDIGWENVIPGNYSRFTFKAEGQQILIKCVYAPNEDSNPNDNENESSKFYKIVLDDKDEEIYDHKIITGDFNVALEHDLDTNGYLHVNNPNTRELIKRQCKLSNLIDVWRLRNKDCKQFTFSKKQARNLTRARLDFFLVSENSTEYIQDVKIGRVCSLSDHRPIHLQMKFSKLRGGGVSGE